MKKKVTIADAKYYVCRTHSHTDKQCLWKVVSRPIVRLQDAESWKSFMESEELNKRHKFFIIQMLDQNNE